MFYELFAEWLEKFVWRRSKNINPFQITIEIADPRLNLFVQTLKPISPLLRFRCGPSQRLEQFPGGFGGQSGSLQDFNARRFFLEQSTQCLQWNRGGVIR